MSLKPHDASIRVRVCHELRKRGLEATPQATTAIVEAISKSPSDHVGDSDSLLLGLLCSGSYTVDILETSGVNPRELLETAEESVLPETGLLLIRGDVRDPVEEFFDTTTTPAACLLGTIPRKRPIECADILRAAVAPTVDYEALTKMLRKGSLKKHWESLIRNRVADVVGGVGIVGDARRPGRRRRILCSDEREAIGGFFEDEHNAQLFADALDSLFIGEKRLSELHREFSAALRDSYLRDDDLPAAASLFLEYGGDPVELECLLESARRLIPQRDQAGIFLFSQGDEIRAGQFTYRNSFLVDTRAQHGFPISRVSIEATRPVPLLAHATLEEFEEILSRDSVKEAEIQDFLDRHDQFLAVLGYAGVRPHVCLTEEGSKDLIPDYILEIPGNRGFDILDLKLPTARMTARMPRLRLSVEVAKAVAQLREYGAYFDSPNNRKAFQRRYGLAPFKPGLIVVIGRSSEFRLPEERAVIEEQLGHTRLLTYDDLIEYGRTRQVDLSPYSFFD